MVCKKCHTQNISTARTCSGCGAPLGTKWDVGEMSRVPHNTPDAVPSPEAKHKVRTVEAPHGLVVAKVFAVISAAAAAIALFLPFVADGGGVSYFEIAKSFFGQLNGSIPAFLHFVGACALPAFTVFCLFASFFRSRSAHILAVCAIVSLFAFFLIVGDILGNTYTVGYLFTNMKYGLIIFFAGTVINIICALGDATE